MAPKSICGHLAPLPTYLSAAEARRGTIEKQLTARLLYEGKVNQLNELVFNTMVITMAPSER